MLRRLSLSASHARVKPTSSVPSLRAVAAAAPQPPVPVPARGLVSTVLLTSETYDKKPVNELRALLRQRDLATTGRKAELIQRLKQSDMQRAGSTLATAQAADPSLTKVRTRRSSRAPKGKEAAERAAAENPAGSLEPGSVSSPAAHPDGTLGRASPASSDPAPDEPTSPPGRPAEKAEPIGEFFNVKVPSERAAPPEEQYIPSIKAYVDPTHDFSDTFRDEWHVAHEPRVHALGAGHQDVSHNASLPSDTPVPHVPGVLAGLVQDVVPKSMQRPIQERLQDLRASTDSIVRDVVADLKQAVPLDAAQSHASKGRPSARRPLNDEEKRGVALLAAIVASGFALGGVAAGDARAPAEQPPAAGAAADAPSAYEAPIYGHHGGQIVGGGRRKV
ncbi:hypothetical protein MOBT1_000399 [Malassezia obtusa]|uniref:SAP domain-containing protein n=1 Tax=Malassezia obtusa TaxID=76774 RepID=A0AAF0E215_9BASI|nr:hypothetical protein MOBT1_000399 [Malassezia obtusa]